MLTPPPLDVRPVVVVVSALADDDDVVAVAVVDAPVVGAVAVVDVVGSVGAFVVEPPSVPFAGRLAGCPPHALASAIQHARGERWATNAKVVRLGEDRPLDKAPLARGTSRMPFIRTIAHGAATGRLRALFDAAKARAGKVFAVVQVQGLQPRVLEASTTLYVRVMQAHDEPLTRAQRELLAAWVSRINGCEY